MSSENKFPLEVKHSGDVLKCNVPFMTLKCQFYNYNADELPAEGVRGEYFWPVQIKVIDIHGHTIITTNPDEPIVVRDDLGASNWVLSHDLYLQFGEPPVEEKYGSDRIRHWKLTNKGRQEFKFYFKFIGLNMEWQQFFPSFFPPTDPDVGEDNLAILNTIGWKGQSELDAQGIGFITKGSCRYAVMTENGARDCVEYLWR
jgi:hypothetical protein